MGSPAIDAKNILEDSGVGVFGTNLFVGIYPDSPDLLVAIFDTGGFPPDDGLDHHCKNPTIMVKVRSSRGDYDAGYNLAESVVNVLHRLHQETWDSRYISVSMMGDVNYLLEDNRGRPTFSINFVMKRTT